MNTPNSLKIRALPAVAALAALLAAGPAEAGLADFFFGHDDGKEVSGTVDLKDFDEIHVAGVYELDVTVGKEFSVTLKGSKDELERVRIEVEDGELMLNQKRSSWFHNTQGVTAVITMPKLSALEVSGVVDATIT